MEETRRKRTKRQRDQKTKRPSRDPVIGGVRVSSGLFVSWPFSLLVFSRHLLRAQTRLCCADVSCSREIPGLTASLDKLCYHHGGASLPADKPHAFVYFVT